VINRVTGEYGFPSEAAIVAARELAVEHEEEICKYDRMTADVMRVRYNIIVSPFGTIFNHALTNLAKDTTPKVMDASHLQ
jgi:hypothetical protein